MKESWGCMRGSWVCRWATAGCIVDWMENKMGRSGSKREKSGSSWDWLGCSWEKLGSMRVMLGSKKEK